MSNKENTGLIDDSPENRESPKEEEQSEKRSLLSILILVVILLLCILGFSYGLYQVLH